jgi:2'-5' RNA ligase
LWQALEDAGLPSPMLELGFPPHLTLMVCQDLNLEGLRSRLPEFIASHPPLPVSFTGVGIFNGPYPVVYLSVTLNRALLDLHANFWKTISPYNHGESSYYRPGMWVPHVTLSQGQPVEKTAAAIETLMRSNVPLYGLLRDLVIADFTIARPGLTEQFKARLGRYL